MNRFRRALPKNIGSMDQVVRILAGGVLIAVALIVPLRWAWVGLYPLLTGLAGSEPLYTLLGVTSHRLGH